MRFPQFIKHVNSSDEENACILLKTYNFVSQTEGTICTEYVLRGIYVTFVHTRSLVLMCSAEDSKKIFEATTKHPRTLKILFSMFCIPFHAFSLNF